MSAPTVMIAKYTNLSDPKTHNIQVTFPSVFMDVA